MFAGNFAPRGWAFCDGQLLEISQNDALFSLFGTNYGGDGRTTFGLPDLRGRVPIHYGSGPGLTNRNLGSKSGSETVTVNSNQLAQHTHTFQSSLDLATEITPEAQVPAQSPTNDIYGPNMAPIVNMASSSISSVGGSQSHSNIMPFQCIHFIVALAGVYPS